MKKIIILCTIIALLFSVTSMSALAEEAVTPKKPKDSRDIPDMLMKKLDSWETEIWKETETVIRCYSISIYGTFSCRNDMKDVFNRYKSDDLFVSISKTGREYLHSVDSDGNYKIDMNRSERSRLIDPATLREYKTQEALKVIYPDIVLINLYYIIGGAGSSAIYYKTNLGNYIFYVRGRSSWLFSEEAFFAYIHDVVQEKIDMYDDDPATQSTTDAWDLSVYDYKSPNFNPNAPYPGSKNIIWLRVGIGTGVLLVAGATVFYFIRRKKSVVAE